MSDDRNDLDFDAVILVTRGDELPKKNYEKKKHPTYETSIRIKHSGKTKVTKPHLVIKFFNQYRDLYDNLLKAGVGENLKVNIDVPFPPSYTSSILGVSLTEDQLQERCYMLNKWMQAVFQCYPIFPQEAQNLISDFLSLDDNDDVGEANKELILSLLRRKQYNRAAATVDAELTPNAAVDPSVATSASNTSKPPLSAATSINNSNSANGGSPSPANTAPPATSGVRFGADVVDSDAKPLRLGNEATKQQSSKFSVYSEAPMLSGAEMEEYSKESLIQSCLAVSVLRGDMIPKSENDSKLHHSYETIIRLVPFTDLLLYDISKDELDATQYEEKIANIPPISVMKVFDGYRSLMLDLEGLGVFPKDHSYKAQDYDEDDATRRRAIVIEAPFPKTFRRSSIGFSLTEQQLQMRVVMLNNWMGFLLRAFPTLPTDAQQVVLIFLGVTVNAKNPGSVVIPAFPEDGADTTEYNNATLFHILRGSFVFPKKKVEPPPPPPSTASSLFKNSGNTNTSAAEKPTTSSNVQEITWINGLNQHPAPAHLGPADGVPEYIIHTFLGVKVVQGEKLLRKSNDSKLHSGYELRIRILTYGELSNPEKIDIDVDQYRRLSSLPPFVVSKVFDAYRSLMRTLEEKRVFSKDKVDTSIGGSVVIDAPFPVTYGKSSLGIGLSDAEKAERASQLNVWMAALLMKFAFCTPEAQAVVEAFLGMEEDNPAEPANKYIMMMLKKTFRPAAKPPAIVDSKASKSNNKATNSKQKKVNKQGCDPDDGTVGAGCACIIS